MFTKRQPALFNEAPKAGVVVVGPLVEAPREQVLAEVVLTLLGVRQVPVARIEALGQE